MYLNLTPCLYIVLYYSIKILTTGYSARTSTSYSQVEGDPDGKGHDSPSIRLAHPSLSKPGQGTSTPAITAVTDVFRNMIS